MESSALSDCEVHAVIRFLNVEGIIGSEIRRRLSNNVYTVHLISSLKCDLGGRYITMEEDLQSAVAESSLNRMPSGTVLASIN